MIIKLIKCFSLTGYISLILLGSFRPVLAADYQSVAAAGGRVMITEIQTGSLTSASEEFIELYNDSAVATAVSGWRLEYYSAGKTNFLSLTQAISLTATLSPQQYYLLAAKNYLAGTAHSSFNPTLAAAGGVLRLAKPDDLKPGSWASVDLVGWGTAAMAEGKPAAPSQPGSSISRRLDSTRLYLDNDNNFNDFSLENPPTPGQAPKIIPVPTPPASGPPPAIYAKPIISEILPNPAAPQLDAAAEFVELQNLTATAIDLTGYSLDSGLNWTNHYKFKAGNLAGNSYEAFMSSQTGLTLTNNGGQIRLKDPAGQVVSQLIIYSEAPAGQAWALFGATWQWTAQPTPGTPNVLVEALPIINSGISQSNSGSTAKKSASISSANSSKSTKTTKSSSSSANNPVTDFATINRPGSNFHWLVIAVIGAGAILYAVYEYRRDLRNKLRQLRSHRKARRTNRSAVEGRGSPGASQ